MTPEVLIVECPRDSWQGMKRPIPAAVKAKYLRELIDAGFRHIDAVSFVSPKAVPQMADSEEVLAELGSCEGAEIIGIVMNRRGAERAAAAGSVSTMGFPFPVSATFAHRNQRQTPEESLSALRDVRSVADQAGMKVIAYLSMAFGNPYGEPWSMEQLIAAIGRVEDSGVRTVSLADTVGCAGLGQLQEVVSEVRMRFQALEVGVHLHGRRDSAEAMVLAAYDAGCRRFDAALGGLGGCPFAQDDRVGNLPTEAVVSALKNRGFEAPFALRDVLRRSEEIGVAYE